MALPVGDNGLVMRSFSEMWAFAQCVSKSGMAPRSLTKPEQILIALQWGAELGVGPMQALANIAVINGRPAIWGDLLVALVRRSGKCEYITEDIAGEGEKMVATCRAKRKGEPHECVRTFSYQDAKRAGLVSKDTYKSYQPRMLQMRARAFALRDLFADVLGGIQIAEEAQDQAFTQTVGSSIESGDDAPLDNLDAVTDLLEKDQPIEAEFEPSGDDPDEPWPAEPAGWQPTDREREKILEQERKEASKLF